MTLKIKTTTPACKHTDADRAWSNMLLPKGADVEDLRKLIPPGALAPLPPVLIDSAVFTLKKLEYSAAMSEETNAFAADIWFRNKKIGYARNDGHGGSTNVQSYPNMHENMEEAEKWARSLPPESAYNRVYEHMLSVDAALAEEDVKSAWWRSTSSMDLESLVDEWVSRKAHRKSISKLNTLVIFSSGKDIGHPVCMQYPRVPTDEAINASKVGDGWVWAVRFAKFFDLPFHYYPAPHPFASSMSMWAPKIRHLPTGKVGEIGRHTTDEIVKLDVDRKTVASGPAADFEFVTEEEGK